MCGCPFAKLGLALCAEQQVSQRTILSFRRHLRELTAEFCNIFYDWPP